MHRVPCTRQPSTALSEPLAHDLQALWPLLPAGSPPSEGDAEAYTAWREQLQQALVCALDEVQVTFACIGHPSGTTVTIIIQVCPDTPLLCLGAAHHWCFLRLQT